MKFSNVKVRHIYNVIFDDVRSCEFDGTHLALVLKRNNDKQTFVVMPLTSESKGVGYNKVKLDRIEALPSNLRENESYAVYNQIRTVNADRFIVLKDDNRKPIDVPVGNDVYHMLMGLGMKDLMFGNTFDEKIAILDNVRDELFIEKAIGIAYDIRDNKGDVNSLKLELKSIAKDLKICYTKSHIKHGIDVIIDKAVNLVDVIQDENVD